jgi:Tol biopolymer transport system component
VRASIALVAVILLAAAGSGSVPASFSATNGEIAFVVGRAIWVVNPDGSGVQRLTNPSPYIFDSGISWSPDGSQLAFVRTDLANCGIPCYSVDTVRADGTGLNLRASVTSDTPRWSPNGTRLALKNYLGGTLRYATWTLDILNLQTGNFVVLAPRAERGGSGNALRFGYQIYDYAWSPDGARICFSRAVGSSHSRLALVRPNGSGLALLGGLRGFDCGWAPDSQRVVFTDGLNISSVDIDGTGLTRLTTQHARELAPLFSPDGSTIAFLRQETGGKHPPYDLWTMAADGSSQTLIAADVSMSSWSPDGALLAFIKGGRPAEDGSHGAPKPDGLWLTHPDASAQVEIAAGATEFAWQARSR